MVQLNSKKVSEVRLETFILIYSMINNFIIASMKIMGGFVLGINLVLADGIQTFANFITDGISLAGAKLSRKRATKHHPFGFGKVEYLANLFVGILLFFLGIFIIIYSLFTKSKIPTLDVLWLLLVAVALKAIAVYIMNKVGDKKHSQLLLTTTEDGKTDLLSNLGVIIITIILQFSNTFSLLRHTELIGSIIISLLVIKSAVATILENSLSLIGEVEESSEEVEKIKEILHEFKEIEKEEITLIKYGAYYKLQLVLELDNSLTLRKISNLENKLRTKIKKARSLKVKHITIYVTNKID